MRNSYADFAARVRVPAGMLLAVLYLVFARPTPGRLVGGALVALAGLMLRAVASGYLAKNQRLATAGPYAFTRNPLYLGSALAGVGFCIAGGRWWFFLLLGVFLIAVYWPVIRREEEHLSRLFPDEFAAYSRTVPVLLPRLTPAQDNQTSPQRFDWRTYWRNREYEALLAFLGIILLLMGRMFLLGEG